jgi:hypothetical protein
MRVTAIARYSEKPRVIGKKEKEELTNLDVEIGYEIHSKSSIATTRGG